MGWEEKEVNTGNGVSETWLQPGLQHPGMRWRRSLKDGDGVRLKGVSGLRKCFVNGNS